MLDRKREKRLPNPGVWRQKLDGEEVVIWNLPDNPVALVYRPKNQEALGEVYGILQDIHQFEETKVWGSIEERDQKRIQTLLRRIRLEKITVEPEKLDLSPNPV